MCLAVPGKVLSIEGGDPAFRSGQCRFLRRRKNRESGVHAGSGPGDFVLVHVGFALTRIDEEEAARTFQYLRRSARWPKKGSPRLPWTTGGAMKYVDEYRDPKMAHAIAGRIARKVTRPWVLMEVCGGQTHTLMRYGIDELLPRGVELVHGPGCPVCVTPLEMVDRAIRIASLPGVIFVSYGDMLRVPGSHTDLFQAKASGADVRIAYSPLDALNIARANPDRKVVFFGVGFETTAPANAMAVWQAKREGLTNFSMIVSHVLVPPAMRLILELACQPRAGVYRPGPRLHGDGFARIRSLSSEFHVPIVVGGFEPVDLLEAIAMLVAQLEEGRAEVENQYFRSVNYEGNLAAQAIMREVFEVSDRKWRGIGAIAESG